MRQTGKQVGDTHETLPSFSQCLLSPAIYVPGPGLDPGEKRKTEQTLSSPSGTYCPVLFIGRYALVRKCCDRQSTDVIEVHMRKAEFSLRQLGEAFLKQRTREDSLPSSE